ncbi:hypothetical protein F183_A32420 [Bryobacterales bacterium F-183]|nr:hypothetical protein F183_A32420 [Bryobacterales bacterium F-183]
MLRSAALLVLWCAVYATVLWPAWARPLWYDEVLTFHMATSPLGISYFGGGAGPIESNPPLLYWLVKASIALFGTAPAAVRLPSVLAFLGASLILCRLIVERLGHLGYGLAAMGIFWSLAPVQLAVEARPYALLLFCFCAALYCWLHELRTGLAISLAGLFLSHGFAPVFGAAIAAGELRKIYDHRRIDWRMWLAMGLPACLVVTYLPMIRNTKAILYPAAFGVTPWTLPSFYSGLVLFLLPAVALFGIAWLVSGKCRIATPQFAPHETAFVWFALLAPCIVIAYSAVSGVVFWNRYGAGAAVAVTLLLTYLLARHTQSATLWAGILLALFCVHRGGTSALADKYSNTSQTYRSIRPDLPFVAASGLAFLEMDHREPNDFTKRLYYLTDRDAAIRLRHATMFEGLTEARRWFPLRGNVTPYSDFVQKHDQFLVLATPDFPEDWLFARLKEDGARIRLVADEKTPYRDRQLYLVELKPFALGMHSH